MNRSPQKNPDRAGFVERFWLVSLVAFVLLTRLFFLDMGFGRADAWRVGLTGKLLATTGQYFPSRPPGFPLVEMISALSYGLFHSSPLTWTVTNALTCLAFCASIVALWALAKRWGVRSPLMVAGVYAFAPLNWVYSVETIDYPWMTSFLIFSVLAVESDRGFAPLRSGVWLGLAAASRFFAALQIVPLLVLAWTKRLSARQLVILVLSFILISLVFYSVVFAEKTSLSEYVGWFQELNKESSRMAAVKGGTLVQRFLIPATSLFGPLATIGFLAAGLWGIPAFVKGLRDRDRGVWAPLLIALFVMVPYIWHLHPNYWIPATGFLLIVLARSVNARVFAVIGTLIILANFPWWQTNIEGLRIIDPYGRNPAIQAYARNLAPFQNENVFNETRVRQLLFLSAEELINRDLPPDRIVMVSLRLPVIAFLVPDIREVDLPLADGSTINVWASHAGGPKFRYMLSPNQVRKAVESGYSVAYLPGIENGYFAEYGVGIDRVEGLEMLPNSP